MNQHPLLNKLALIGVAGAMLWVAYPLAKLIAIHNSGIGGPAIASAVADGMGRSTSAMAGANAELPVKVHNTLTVYEVDGKTQTNRPITFGRPFAEGEVADCPEPLVSGSPAASWQADVKNRWPDGSAKFAVVSLIATITAKHSVTISFQSSPSCNNKGFITTSSSPSFSTFNQGNYDAEIKVTPGAGASSARSVIVSAKTMLAASDPGANMFGDCKNDYWLQGPVVTAVIVQDCTAAMTYDFGWKWNATNMASDGSHSSYTTTNKYASFHPMFILYFYPSINAAECEEIIENDWNGKIQDQLADFDFLTDDAGGSLRSHWSRTGARIIPGVAAKVTNSLLPVVSIAQLASSQANFTASDTGMSVCVTKSGYSNPVCGTIRSVINNTTAVMALPTLDGMWEGGSGLTAYMDLQSAATRHRKTFWSGDAPGHIRIDYNFPYLIATKALPNYDLVNAYINPHNGYYPSGKCCDYGYDGWVLTDRGEIGGSSGITGGYAAVLEGAPLQRADLALLYNMGDCGSSNGKCAVALQQLSGASAIGDLSTHAKSDSGSVTRYDVSGGGGLWDVFGGVPFHFRESRTAATRNSFNGVATGNVISCYYVSQFENKNATYSETLNPSSSSQCLGGGDGNVPDPSGPNSSVGRAPSLYAHSDLGAGQGTLGPAPVGSLLNPPYGWDVEGEGAFHWLDYAYLPYLLTGSPFYLENEYQSASFQPNFSSGYNGIFSLYNGHYIIRWLAWGMQSASRAAFIAPDASADQAYWMSVVNSNIEFMEGALSVTGTKLTPAKSQGNFASTGAVSRFNVDAANRWDLGRYNEITGTACATTGSGSCAIVPSRLHQWTQGFCDNNYPAIDHSKTSAVLQYWMYWYNNVVFGEMRDMGFNQAAAIQNQMGQFLEGMLLSPTNNPWYGIASYESPVTTGPSSACKDGIGQNLPFFVRYGGSSGIFGGWIRGYGNPTTPNQGSFSFTPPPGGITTGNFPCADHGYSLLARAAGSFLSSYGVDETDADGTYKSVAAWNWLNTNVPYFGNTAYRKLRDDCVPGSDIQIKWALAPRP